MAEKNDKNDSPLIYTNKEKVKHTTRESDNTAHKALSLAQELEKKMKKSALEGVLEQSKENASWFALYFSGIVIICMLGTATGRMYQKYNKLADVGGIWEMYGYMITATVFLGLFFSSAMNHMILGKSVIFYSLFISTFALAIGIFITLVAVRSRILPH
jgi:hypothetical protein